MYALSFSKQVGSGEWLIYSVRRGIASRGHRHYIGIIACVGFRHDCNDSVDATGWFPFIIWVGMRPWIGYLYARGSCNKRKHMHVHPNFPNFQARVACRSARTSMETAIHIWCSSLRFEQLSLRGNVFVKSELLTYQTAEEPICFIALHPPTPKQSPPDTPHAFGKHIHLL